MIDIIKLMLKQSPEEEYEIEGKKIIVRRDDLAYLPPLPPNAKMIAMYKLCQQAADLGYKKVIMFAKKQQGQSYITGLPVFARAFDLQAIITYPKTENQPLPEWVFALGEYGKNTEIRMLHPNMVTINLNQTKKIAEQEEAFYLPLGFDCKLAVNAHADKFTLPRYKIGTLVLSTMTGIVLAGLLRQIYERAYQVEKVIAISGGREPESVTSTMSMYLSPDELKQKHLILNPYERNFKAVENIGAGKILFPLHPDYEAKAWYWLTRNLHLLKEPIYFINTGR